jgi:FkbM family methyltransferase
MLNAVRSGDVVWDIGANVGYYTTQFLHLAGAGGQVIAFEPAPACFATLKTKFHGHENIRLINAAMGQSEGKVTMSMDPNPLAATHKIESANGGARSNAGATIEVDMLSGDLYVQRGGPTPQVIKVDVEGFEEQVFLGMRETLQSPRVRAIFCEMHFGILEERGDRMAPVRIEKMLKDLGFMVAWIDASHVGAYRQ